MGQPSYKLQFSKEQDHCDWISSLPNEILVTILHKLDTKQEKLSLAFSGSAECTDVVNCAIASAAERSVMDIDVAIVGHTEYEFPSCFRGFSSLTKFVLVVMDMSLKDTQVLLLRNCTNLQSLHLIDINDIIVLQLPKLEELVWLWTSPCGTFKIDTPALRTLDYCGEVLLPTSTFQSLPCLQHVSLQYVRYLSCFESHTGAVWDDSNFEHSSLKEVEMYNFKGRDNEIGFARLLLHRAPNMRHIAFSQAPLREALKNSALETIS
ncbi:hypothetical protein SETIT_2G051400v2 [Setaria italica]|uniref:F-box domain-containing protein n=1 Tax=Setaria italica TaxID=4555 RepID=A0A368PVG0_SETIT|nr:hypothetical protein SETIT_2G051400v2 [Setaria italica]